MSRSTTDRIVLENLYQLAQIPPPANTESGTTGHPLAAHPIGAAWVFYLAWPLAVALAAWVNFRTRSHT